MKNPKRLELGPANVYIANVEATPDIYGDLYGSETDVGYLGDDVMYQVITEAASLTGAQSGNVPLDKIIIGGSVKVVLPFKEISLENLQIGVPSAIIVQSGGLTRVDFIVAVGQSMRQTLAKRMRITKIKGGKESTDPADTIIIPEISPAEGEVHFPFAPTVQRVILTNWYAWPDPEHGRWAWMGDEGAGAIGG